MTTSPPSSLPSLQRFALLIIVGLALFATAAGGAAVGSWLVVRRMPRLPTPPVVALAADCPQPALAAPAGEKKRDVADRPRHRSGRNALSAKPAPRLEWWRDVVKTNPYL